MSSLKDGQNQALNRCAEKDAEKEVKSQPTMPLSTTSCGENATKGQASQELACSAINISATDHHNNRFLQRNGSSIPSLMIFTREETNVFVCMLLCLHTCVCVCVCVCVCRVTTPSSSLFSRGTLQAMRLRAARPSSATIFLTLSWLLERWNEAWEGEMKKTEREREIERWNTLLQRTRSLNRDFSLGPLPHSKTTSGRSRHG